MNGVAKRAKQFQTLGDIQLVTVAISVERLTFDVLHHEIRKAIFSCAAVEQTADMRMIECREYLSLFTKTAQDEVGIHTALHQFYCGSFIELVVGARGFVDGAHAAASNLSLDSIRAETTSEHRIFFFNKRLERAHLSVSVH